MSAAKQTPKARSFVWDALSAVAFLAVALVCTRYFARAFTPIGGFFFFVVTAGLGWRYARLAWQDVLQGRQKG